MQAAQRRILERYASAIRRYLAGILRDREAADELFQNFALRFVRGDFRGVDPSRGRFRKYLKGALSNLVADYYRERGRRPLPLGSEVPEPAESEVPEADSDAQFLRVWRNELLSRTWRALHAYEQRTQQPLHTVLSRHINQPKLRSAELATQLAPVVGQSVDAAWVRKRKYLAREKFTELLLDEVAQSLSCPSVEALEEELIDLDLLAQCRPALERRRQACRPG
jgi:RNA polymerase sigma factor (sigma-70 family)